MFPASINFTPISLRVVAMLDLHPQPAGELMISCDVMVFWSSMVNTVKYSQWPKCSSIRFCLDGNAIFMFFTPVFF